MVNIVMNLRTGKTDNIRALDVTQYHWGGIYVLVMPTESLIYELSLQMDGFSNA